MKKRIITAIVLCALLIPLVFIGGIAFDIGIGLISFLAFREIINLKDIKIPLLMKLLSYISVVLLSLSYDSLLPCIGIIFLFIFIPIVFYSDDEYNFDIGLYLFGNIIFIGISFYVINFVRFSSLEEFLYILMISVLTDTCAYIGGKTFGKHKLIPRVSPNKTIEGSLIGSFFGTLIPSIYYIYYVDPSINAFIVIVVTFIITILSQIGDLIFSSIKRHYKVKDFSSILPGHGGILDRFDSLIIVSIVYMIIKVLFI